MKTKSVLFFLAVSLCVFCTEIASAQNHIGVSLHQSEVTRVGIFVDIEDLFLVETRLMDFVTLENITLEFLGFYKFTSRYSSEIYAGGGYGLSQIEQFSGPIAAVGVNVFPFKNKNFGFHFELNPIFPEISDPLVRASWGIRYKFIKDGN